MATVVDLVCRLCLTKKRNLKLKCIFNDDDFAHKIFNITGIQLSNINGLPTSICIACNTKLNAAIEFRIQCLESHSKLMKDFAASLEITHKEIKKEVNALNTEEHKMSINKISKLDLAIIEMETKSELISTNLEIEETGHKIPDDHLIIDQHFVPNITSEDILKKKIRNVKKQSRKVCQICGKMCLKLDQHLKIHSGVKDYKCPHCKKAFSQLGHLTRHINTHTGLKAFKCKLCGRAFAEKNSVKSHMVTHTGERKYQCKICGISFGYGNVLAAHIKTHIQDRRHDCSFCDKLFLTKEALKRHIRTHTGEKPYKCEFCPKSFTTSYNRSTHRRVHTKERPYKCNMCDMNFAYLNIKTSHMKMIHGPATKVKVETKE